MNTLNITKKIMRENKIYAKKKFGQNFLIDDQILQNIVDSAEITNEETVIEIGPGLGNLTEYILGAGAKVIAFEIDDDMISILEKRFEKNEYILIKEQDILAANLREILLEQKVKGKIKVIANLPYYITTPIIYKLLENTELIESITIMVQKEVAQRLVATPHSKEYGILTITTSYKADIEGLFDVPNTCFIPSPNVTSSVIKITPNRNKNKELLIKDEKLFVTIVKNSFSARRKKLLNSIMNANTLTLEKNKIEKIILSHDIDLNSRAEDLSIEDYVKISNSIFDDLETNKKEVV